MKEDVYYVSPEGKITRVSTVCKKPNGILLTADGKTLYLADNGGGASTATTSSARADWPTKLSGSIWARARRHDARRTRQSLRGVRPGRRQSLPPHGKPIGVIEVPYASNCVFGGKEFKTLYVTSADKFLGIKTKVRGGAAAVREVAVTVE